MRLGQLARKHDIPVQDIIDYLEEATGESFHPNAKVYDGIESKIYEHFELVPNAVPEPEPENPPTEEVEEEKPEEIEEPVEKAEPEHEIIKTPSAVAKALTPEEEIAAVDGELAPDRTLEVAEEVQNEEEKEVSQEEPKVKELEVRNADEIIETDKLLEMLESGEVPADLDKIKLIKAPKKELAGLKVVGKVELPEPKKKPEPEGKEESEERRTRNQRPQISEEEREKRRLQARRKREENEARNEKRRKAREQKELKARKEAHYREKLGKAKQEAIPQKQKVREPEAIEQIAEPIQEQLPQPAQPKSALGKFWRWLNT